MREEHQARHRSFEGMVPQGAWQQRGWRRRVDPDDGRAYDWQELLAFYKGKYKKKEIEAYWETCKLEKSRKGRKAEMRMMSSAWKLQSNRCWRRPQEGGAASL